MMNRLIGRNKIIWGTWDDEIPKHMIDIFFDLYDLAGRHPIKSHEHTLKKSNKRERVVGIMNKKLNTM